MGRLAHKTIGDIDLIGFSLAGEESVVAAPQHNVCFDVGRAPCEIISIDNVCISHGHMDHAAGVAYYLSQRNFVGNAPGRVIIHRDLAQYIQKLMDVWSDIEGHPSPGQVLGVEPLEDVAIRRDLIVRSFTVNHSASALGYAIIESRHKLKEEFQGKSGPQLVELKRRGIEIERHVEVPLVTYTGDTAIGRWMDLDFVRSTRVLIVECTFFDREHVNRAREGRHIHVNELQRVLDAAPEAQVVLTHVTRRTDLRRAKRILERTINPADLDRTSFLMERPPRGHAPPRSPDGETRPNRSSIPAASE